MLSAKIPKLGFFPPPPNNTLCSSSTMGLASLALARLQVDKASAAPFFVLWLLPLHALPAAFDFVSFPLHAFLLPLVLSCFSLTHFLLLWLCLVSSSCVSCCCGFVRFHLTLLSAKSEFILIPLYKGIMDFLPYIGLGLLTYFAFFSLHLFNTLGWVCWPLCFLFSSFIHFIGLGLLTLLFSFLFVYSTGPHLLGSILFLYLLGFSNTHFSLWEWPPITHLSKGTCGPTLAFTFYSQHYSFKKAFYYSTPERGLWDYLWVLFSKYSSFLGHHLDLIYGFSSL